MKMRFVPRRAVALPATVVAAALAASCSGGDSSGPPAPYAQYAQRCANPPTGDQQGTLTDEKNWLRTWIDDTYLWYREVPTLDPAQYATAIDYFAALKTPLLNPSGTPKDKFHFTMSTADWLAFVNSGNAVSYGVDFFAVNRSAPNRDLRVAFVANGGPGAIAGFRRGTQITNVDGANVADGDANVINAGLAPTSTSPTHSFQYVLPGSTTTQSVNLTAVSLTEDPVPVRQVFPGPNGTSFGYLLFNDQIKTAENELISAINFFKGPPKITELVLDLRYNGGGLLYIASQLAYMISGPSTAGATFEALTFNDKHRTVDPAGNAVVPTPFFNITTQGAGLPTLGLKRVFVLTGPGTCSASEAVINGLRGVNVDVVQIGATTCGKPYGFYATDDCGTTYFAIQFQGFNAKGFGAYPDGFVPGSTDPTQAGLPGCAVAEDFSHELGDPNDARVVAAMNWSVTPGTCPPPPVAAAARQSTSLSAAASDDAIRTKPPWREIRVLR